MAFLFVYHRSGYERVGASAGVVPLPYDWPRRSFRVLAGQLGTHSDFVRWFELASAIAWSSSKGTSTSC